jgi:hypothetical protein
MHALEVRFPQFFDELGQDTWHAIRERVHWINWATVCDFLGEHDPLETGPLKAPYSRRWFPASFALNRSNFRQPPEREPANGDAGRPNRGVLMVRLSEQFAQEQRFPIPPDTFVHFSWRGGAAVLRNYFHLPATTRNDTAAAVFASIVQEVEVPDRASFTDLLWWNAKTHELNAQYPAANA